MGFRVEVAYFVGRADWMSGVSDENFLQGYPIVVLFLDLYA